MKRFIQWMTVAMVLAVMAPAMQAQFLVAFYPSGLDFGTVEVGQTKELQVALVYWGTDDAQPNTGWSAATPSESSDQYTILGVNINSSPMRQGDTMKLTVVYHPTAVGEHAAVFQCQMAGVVASLSIKGEATSSTGLTMKQSDCADVEVGTTGMCTMTFTNNSAIDMRMQFEGIDAPFAGFSTDGGITFDDFLSLVAGESAELVFSFTPTTVGSARDEFLIINSDDTIVSHLEGNGIDASAPKTIVVTPNGATMKVDDNTQSATQAISIYNAGTTAFALSLVEVVGADASAFSVTINALPKTLEPAETLTFDVTFTPSGDQTEYSAQLHIEGNMNSFFGVEEYVDLYGVVGTPGTDTLRIGLMNTGGPIGGTALIMFTNQSAIPANIAYGHATLRYNASVLVPQQAMIDDVIEGGMRTSTFRIDPESRLQGTTLAQVAFTITLGDAEQTPVDLVGMEWYNDQDAPLNTQTVANGAVVSVDDAEGRTVNANGDVLTLAVSPMPALDNVTITYLRTPGNASLIVYDATGKDVKNFSAMLQGAPEQGSLQVSLSDLTTGTYYLRMSVGTSTVVRRIVVN